MSPTLPRRPSLRAFAEPLSKILGSTPDAIYERQRSLVRVGLLQLDGRGRGGGVKATPRSLALLLIAFLASDSPLDAGERAKKLARLRPIVCPDPFIDQSNLLDALAATIANENMPINKLPKIEISRTSSHAILTWPAGYANGTQSFYSADTSFPHQGVRVVAQFAGLAPIKRELWKMERNISYDPN